MYVTKNSNIEIMSVFVHVLSYAERVHRISNYLGIQLIQFYYLIKSAQSCTSSIRNRFRNSSNFVRYFRDSLMKYQIGSRGVADPIRFLHSCSETSANRRIPVPHKYPPPLRIEPGSLNGGKQMGEPLDQWNCVWMQWDCRLSTGLPPSSRLCWLWCRKEDLQRAWNRDRRAVWDQVGWSHCRPDDLVTVRDIACLRRGHNDHSCRGHQCSETTLTGESRFHISTPLGITGSLTMEANGWTTGLVELFVNAVRLQALHTLAISRIPSMENEIRTTYTPTSEILPIKCSYIIEVISFSIMCYSMRFLLVSFRL